MKKKLINGQKKCCFLDLYVVEHKNNDEKSEFYLYVQQEKEKAGQGFCSCPALQNSGIDTYRIIVQYGTFGFISFSSSFSSWLTSQEKRHHTGY